MHVAPRIVVHCCPLLPQILPRHAPDDAQDMPQMMPQTCLRHTPDNAPDMHHMMPQLMPQTPLSIIFDILKAPAFQKYST